MHGREVSAAMVPRVRSASDQTKLGHYTFTSKLKTTIPLQDSKIHIMADIYPSINAPYPTPTQRHKMEAHHTQRNVLPFLSLRL